VTLHITIKMDNDAFGDPDIPEQASYELARILRDYAQDIEGDSGYDHTLRDVNGNTVGKAVTK